MAQLIFKICIPHTHRDFFDYSAEVVDPCIGARVWVSFRKQTRMGVVVGKELRENIQANIKSIATVIDDKPLLTGELLAKRKKSP